MAAPTPLLVRIALDPETKAEILALAEAFHASTAAPAVSAVEWATAADLVRTLDPAEVRRRHEQATLYASAAVDTYDAFLTVVADMLDGKP